MECMTDIVTAVTIFVTNIINFLDKHNGSIMCFLTFGIMIFTAVTAKIANQKRKDDLFKIRWEVYGEIIIKLKAYYSEVYTPNYNHEISYQEHMKDEFLTYNGLNEAQYKEIVHNNLISKIRWLFNDEIAHMVKNLLINDPEENSKFVNITFYEDSMGTFCVTKEFTKKFDKYLKLNEV